MTKTTSKGLKTAVHARAVRHTPSLFSGPEAPAQGWRCVPSAIREPLPRQALCGCWDGGDVLAPRQSAGRGLGASTLQRAGKMLLTRLSPFLHVRSPNGKLILTKHCPHLCPRPHHGLTALQLPPVEMTGNPTPVRVGSDSADTDGGPGGDSVQETVPPACLSLLS